MPSCSECALVTVWDDELNGSVCTACGTVTNPSCSVLTDPQSSLYSSSSSTLKSFRAGQRWDLPGQGRQARDRKNTFAIHEFIRSITSGLSDSGLTPRAINLFSQAMALGRYRWGRKAKLTAAASVAIARRESLRSDSLRTIAIIIDEPPLSLSRAFSSVIHLLGLSITCTDPALHIPTLQSHLSSFIHSPQPPDVLSPALRNILVPLSLPSVARTANALSDLLTHLTDTHSLINLPTPPTACAILILALEGEIRSPLPHLGHLANHLAAHFGVGKAVVMSRYKLIYDIIEEWTKELPWLDKFETAKNNRSKVAKRTVVARGLKDVIQFREAIWKNKLKALEHPTIILDVDEDTPQGDGDPPPRLTPEDPAPTISTRPRKTRKTRNALDDASRFLLNPLSAPLLPSIDTSAYSLPLTTYLLTTSPSTLTLETPPTRLQRLAHERGGDDIADEELFEDTEWESIFRSEEEIAVLRDTMGWGSDEESAPEVDVRKTGPLKTGVSKRINMDILEKLLHDKGTLGEEELDWLEGVPLEEGMDHDWRGSEDRCRTPANEVEVVENWYPVSPDGRGCSFGVGDRYDEEC